jgi:pimeloyl-ACP methyl ester carboxylesterase
MEIRQIHAGDLDVGYVDAGPRDGPAVLLLHGWPYDIHAFDEVTPLLVAQGCRVVVPYLRGYGTTRFLSDATPRNGEQAVFAVDAVALLDALGIARATVAGFDWGSRAAAIMAAAWPERCAGLVAVSGYLIGSVEAGRQPLTPEAERGWWYLFYFATERGRAGYARYTHDFAKLVWRLASPKWVFDDATFDRTAASFANPDHVDIVIHNYPLAAGARGRGGAPPRPREGARGPSHDRRADDHDRQRLRRPRRRRTRVRRPVHRPPRAPRPRRDRARRAPGGARGVRRRGADARTGSTHRELR